MMQEMTELSKMDSHILFLAKHKELKDIRLFMIQIYPWARCKTDEPLGRVLCFQTLQFSMPDLHLSRLKRAELLIA